MTNRMTKSPVARRLLVRLSVRTPEPIYVSKNRAPEFKAWMTEG